MLDAARLAAGFAAEHRRADLDTDPLATHGLVRLIEIIGEAASRVTASGREELPEIPWVGIIGMRNRLVHGYYDVDLDIVWNTLLVDLPPLIVQLERAL